MNLLYIVLAIYAITAILQIWYFDKRLKSHENDIKKLATQTHQVAVSQLNQAMLLEHLNKQLETDREAERTGE